MSRFSRDELVAKGARFFTGEELAKKGIDVVRLEIALCFGQKVTVGRLRDAGIQVGDNESVVHWRVDGEPCTIKEIAIFAERVNKQ